MISKQTTEITERNIFIILLLIAGSLMISCNKGSYTGVIGEEDKVGDDFTMNYKQESRSVPSPYHAANR